MAAPLRIGGRRTRAAKNDWTGRMLRQIRGAMKSAVTLLFVVPLIVAFAAWGVPEMRQLTRTDAIRVGKSGMSAALVQREFDRLATNRRLSGDETFDRAAAIAQGVPNQIVQSLATRAALDQDAAKMGLIMPRKAVRDFLQSSEQFKNPRTGKFDNEVLTNILREYSYGVREFEDRLQSDLLRNQLTSALTDNGGVPDALIDALVLRETESRAISYLTVTDDIAGEAAAATPETLKKYYDDNSAQFMAPEYRTLTAVVLKNADYVESDAVSEEELRKAYDDGKARYETPEKRTFRQLTFDDAKAASDAVAALNAGKPFETLASEQGKTLDAVTFTDAQKRDIVDPKVADAVFAEKAAGSVIGPVDGVFGKTVVQLVAISPASVKSFEEVRAELEAESQSRGSKKKLFEAIEEIENARDTGASLADAAKNAGAKSTEYGPVDSYSFGVGGEIVSDIPAQVLREAFKLDEGEESDAIELDDKSGYFLVAVSEIRPPAIMPYDNVASEVETRWRASERQARIEKTLRSIRDAISGGKTLKEAAEALNRAPIEQRVTRRSAGQILSQPMIEQIFSADQGEPVSGPAAIGDAQVIAVVDGVAYDVAQISPDDIGVFSQYVGNQLNQELIDAYAGSVLSDMKPKINQAQIDALFSEGQ